MCITRQINERLTLATCGLSFKRVVALVKEPLFAALCE